MTLSKAVREDLMRQLVMAARFLEHDRFEEAKYIVFKVGQQMDGFSRF